MLHSIDEIGDADEVSGFIVVFLVVLEFFKYKYTACDKEQVSSTFSESDEQAEKINNVFKREEVDYEVTFESLEYTTYTEAEMFAEITSDNSLSEEFIEDSSMYGVPSELEMLDLGEPIKEEVIFHDNEDEENEFVVTSMSEEESYSNEVNEGMEIFDDVAEEFAEFDNTMSIHSAIPDDSDFALDLRPHQLNAVARAVYGRNALIGHAVGAGKSAVMFASIMKKKQLGLINKACVVVPKPLTEQTAAEFRRLYPAAKLLSVTNEDLATEAKRKIFNARVATGNYDAVIMSQEQFEKIPMSKSYCAEYIRKELDTLEDSLRDRMTENKGRIDYSVKAIEKRKKMLLQRLDKIINPKSASREKDNLLEFESLGFDCLVVDEAHAYKNGFISTKMTNVAGVNTRASGRSSQSQILCKRKIVQ